MKNRTLALYAAMAFLGALWPLGAILTLGGCGTTAQSVSYQTIGSLETAVLNANASFLDSVVLGKTPTNSVPQVESAFNEAQMALHLAAVLASGGTNAPAPAATAAKANAFITTATTATK